MKSPRPLGPQQPKAVDGRFLGKKKKTHKPKSVTLSVSFSRSCELICRSVAWWGSLSLKCSAMEGYPPSPAPGVPMSGNCTFLRQVENERYKMRQGSLEVRKVVAQGPAKMSPVLFLLAHPPFCRVPVCLLLPSLLAACISFRISALPPFSFVLFAGLSSNPLDLLLIYLFFCYYPGSDPSK